MSDNNSTQADINAMTGRAIAAAPDAVQAHTEAPAPATTGEQVDSFHARMAAIEARMMQIEQIIGVVAPTAGAVASLIPGGAAVATPVLTFLPAVENTVNTLLAAIGSAFSGKVAAHVQKLPPAPGNPQSGA